MQCRSCRPQPSLHRTPRSDQARAEAGCLPACAGAEAMSATTDPTHDSGLQSWLESANDPTSACPGSLARPCGRRSRKACERAARRSSGSAKHWCRSLASRWDCPARSATTPTSTPASITPPRWASSSVLTIRCCRTTSGSRSAITAVHRRSPSAVAAWATPSSGLSARFCPRARRCRPWRRRRAWTANSNSASSSRGPT